MHRLSAIDRTARCASQAPADNTVTRQVLTFHVMEPFILPAHRPRGSEGRPTGEPRLHLIGPCVRGSPQGSPREPGVSRETFGDRSITRRPDFRLVTGSRGLNALPRLRPTLRETPGEKGTTPEFPFTRRPVPRRRTHQRPHRGPPTPPMNPRPRSLDVFLSTELAHISTLTDAARHC